jgi:hypothetical protein
MRPMYWRWAFSSNDYVGHTFGPHSLEVEDMCYRTDEALATTRPKLLGSTCGRRSLDAWRLSADHAVSAPFPSTPRRSACPLAAIPLGDVAKLREKLDGPPRRDKFGPRARRQASTSNGSTQLQLFLTPVDDAARFAKTPTCRPRFSAQNSRAWCTPSTRNELLDPATPAIMVPENLRLLTPVRARTPLEQFRLERSTRNRAATSYSLFRPTAFKEPPRRPMALRGSTIRTFPVMWLGHGIRATPAAIDP